MTPKSVSPVKPTPATTGRPNWLRSLARSVKAALTVGAGKNSSSASAPTTPLPTQRRESAVIRPLTSKENEVTTKTSDLSAPPERAAPAKGGRKESGAKKPTAPVRRTSAPTKGGGKRGR